MKFNPKPETLSAIKLLLQSTGAPEDQIENVLRAARNNPTRPRMGTIKQAAGILQCHVRTVGRYCKNGMLHPVRLSCRRIRYDLDEVERLMLEGGCHE